MQRGSQSIFKNLFNEPATAPASPEQPTRHQKKIQCIIDYYYCTGRKKVPVSGRMVSINYFSLINLVAETFFLSPVTVREIIESNREKTDLLKQEWKDKEPEAIQKAMQKKWPMLVW